jgi:predicted RecB family nuclease
MKERQGTIYVSATDLANHLSCRHLTTLDIRLAKQEIPEPSWENPHLRALQQRGLEHERAYVNNLRSKGLSIADLSNEPEETANEATRVAMQAGVQAIVQASLASGDWRGRADVLLRVERLEKPSRLGNWAYEALDCKLARETKAETILQLCLYSELVAELQGVEPEFFHVVRPNVGLQLESYRLSAFAAYHRAVKISVLGAVTLNRSATAISAGGGKNVTDSAAVMTICRLLLELPNYNARN